MERNWFMGMKKLTTRNIRNHKVAKAGETLQVLTCYDFQTAQMLSETAIDMLLVGDSLGNVVLGYDTTVEVSLTEMSVFGAAVKRGAPNKFVIVDMPFGTYTTFDKAVENSIKLYQETKAEALKLEGGFPHQIDIINRLTQSGIPVMGHIGLTPQSVHQQGGYYKHGKSDADKERLLTEAKNLEAAGCFSIVLECVTEEIANLITKEISIPTIGIGAGNGTDGQVLVINDLLKMGPGKYPSFCKPIANLYEMKRDLISKYIEEKKIPQGIEDAGLHH